MKAPPSPSAQLAASADLLSAAGVLAALLDRELRVLAFTPAFARMFDLSPDDVGRPLSDLPRRVGDAALIEDLRAVLADGSPREREVQAADGRWLLRRALPHPPAGAIAGVALTLIDIDAVKRAELRCRKLLEVSGAIAWTVDRGGVLQAPLVAVERFTGLPAGELARRAIHDIVHEGDRARVRAAWEDAARREVGLEIGCRVWSQAHGAYRRVAMHAAPSRDPDVGGDGPVWLGSFHDVEGYLSAQERADVLNAQLRVILEHSPSPIFLKDRDGRYLFASPIVGQIFGRGDFTGKTDAELHSPEVAAMLRDHDVQVMESGDPMKLEERVLTPAGERVYMSTKFPIFGADGEVAGVAGVSTDVTAQKQQEARDRDAIAQRDRFIAMMSHELRTPLAAIVNASYALQLPSNTPAEVDDAVRIIDRQARHLTRLVDDLLDVARIERGMLRVGDGVVDLAEVARGAVAGARRELEAAGLALALACPDDRPIWVRGDAVRLEQVLANLLSNALRFTAAGGVVTVSVGVREDSARVSVRDTGVGLSVEECERVFELFYQREQSSDRRTGGLGVGLALARQLVEAHGGRITARSEGAGRGSEFVVELPLDTSAVAVEVVDQVSALPDLSRATIVIVEDGEDSRVLLAMLLERLGHAVIAVGTGAEGVEAIARHRPSLALVDIGLPDIDGYELARRVRASDSCATYLVALTGYGMPSDRRRALDAGFDEHLVKPLRPEVLKRLAQSRSR